jgi:hypothetical protein
VAERAVLDVALAVDREVVTLAVEAAARELEAAREPVST